MAFLWAGDLNGNRLPVVKRFPVAANVYAGQLLMAYITVTGGVKPPADAAAGPDTASQIIGICSGIVTSPTFDSTYKGDLGTRVAIIWEPSVSQSSKPRKCISNRPPSLLDGN